MYYSFLQLTGAQGRIPTKLHASLCIQLLDKGNNCEKKDDCFWDYGFVLKQYGVLWGFKEILPSSISIQLLLFILWDNVMLWVFLSLMKHETPSMNMK